MKVPFYHLDESGNFASDPAVLKAVLDLRESHPEIVEKWKGTWVPHPSQPGSYNLEGEPISGDIALHNLGMFGRIEVPGHGVCEIIALHGVRADQSESLIVRGGLGVAYLTSTWQRFEGGEYREERISWIEPGVPDQERRERKHVERMRRAKRTPAKISRPSWQLFHPLAQCVESLETKGRTFFSEVNQHGDGWSGSVWFDGDDVCSDVSCSGGPTMDYGVKQLRDVLVRGLRGEWPEKMPHFNSCVRCTG